MRYQQVPDAGSYADHHAEFMEVLRGAVGEHHWDPALISPYPFLVSADEMRQVRQLAQSVFAGLMAVIERYPLEPRIQAKMALDPRLRAILLRAQHRPMQRFTFRPDFLYDRHGVMQICEINARFPSNGYYYSEAMGTRLDQLSYLPRDRGSPEGATLPCRAVIASHFDPERPVAILRQSEVGHNIFWLLKEHDHFAVDVTEVRRRGDGLEAQGRRFCQVSLEIDRTELLSLDPGVLAFIVDEAAHLNDVRALILVHDKRVLSVLSDPSIMGDYLPPEACALLQRHIVPTFTLHERVFVDRVKRERHGWILKRNSGGRGVGMYVGEQTDQAIWERILDEERSQYHVQTYVDQAEFPLVKVGGVDIEAAPAQIVGSILCYAEQCFGLGVFRGSIDSAVVNVHKGRGSLIAQGVIAPEPTSAGSTGA